MLLLYLKFKHGWIDWLFNPGRRSCAFNSCVIADQIATTSIELRLRGKLGSRRWSSPEHEVDLAGSWVGLLLGWWRRVSCLWCLFALLKLRLGPSTKVDVVKSLLIEWLGKLFNRPYCLHWRVQSFIAVFLRNGCHVCGLTYHLLFKLRCCRWPLLIFLRLERTSIFVKHRLIKHIWADRLHLTFLWIVVVFQFRFGFELTDCWQLVGLELLWRIGFHALKGSSSMLALFTVTLAVIVFINVRVILLPLLLIVVWLYFLEASAADRGKMALFKSFLLDLVSGVHLVDVIIV